MLRMEGTAGTCVAPFALLCYATLATLALLA
jgi:hypothetical protein